MLDRMPVADPAPFGAKAASGLSVAVLLTDGFSMLSLSAITEALSLASRQAGHTGEKVRLVGFPSRWPLSRSGVQVVVDHAIDRAGAADGLVDWHDGLFLCTGEALTAEQARMVLRLARSARRHAKPICVIGAAVHVLAQSGLVTGCTDHWTRVASLRETVSSASVQESIFVRDGHVITSPGETAALDLVFALIRERLGQDVASEVSAQLLVESVRNGNRPQPRFAANRYRGVSRELGVAIDMLESMIEDPPSMQKVASSAKVSVRQLERLFARHLQTSPQKFGRQAQLNHAMKLLEQSSMEIVEIALACGFRGSATFNRHFKRAFGVTPSKYRLFRGSRIGAAAGRS